MHWFQSKIGAKLLTIFSLLLMLSMLSLNYLATKQVSFFGEFSASRNEANIKEHTYTFLSRITYEQTMRYDAAFEKISAHSSLIAKRAKNFLDNIDSYGKAPRTISNSNECLSISSNGIYCNRKSDEIMVSYWGSPYLSPEIVRQLNALSHLDPSLQDGKESNPAGIAAYIVTESAICRYYPNVDATEKFPPPSPYDMRRKNFYTSARLENNPERKTVWSEIFRNSTGNLLITASTPIYGKDGKFLGVAAIDVSLANIVDDFSEPARSNSSQKMMAMFSFLVDNKGRLIACPPQLLRAFGFKGKNCRPTLKNYKPLEISTPEVKMVIEEMLEEEFIIKRFLLSGRPYLISSRAMPSTGWRIAVVVPESVILASVEETKLAMEETVNSITTKFALITFSFLICSILAAVLLSIKYLIIPLKTLSKAASRVSEGDLATHVDISGKDEIGTLAVSFNNMVGELKKSKELEKEYTRTLEAQVRRRTRRLRNKNDELHDEIVERRQAENALRTSEWKYRQLYENSRDGFVTWNMNGNFLECNLAYEKMLGYRIEELRQMSNRDITPEKWNDWESKTLRREILNKGYSGVYEKEYRRKDGSVFPVELSVHLIRDISGKAIGMWAFARDITERKQRVEELRIAKEEAEAATRAKSLFLANMSHEIRTPMNAILGFAELLDEYIDEEQQKQYLSSIASSGKTLLGLINDILDLSKIEAGRLEIQYKPVNPRSIIDEIANIFSREVAKKGLDFHVDINPQLPEILLLDEIRLRQILLNLVGNAVKFTQKGYIGLSVDQVTRESDTLNLTFSIKDTGIGIANDQVQLIFDAFKQQEGQSTSTYGGTGLGLTITKRLVEMMGGKISVESEIGKGSTFHVLIQDVIVPPSHPSGRIEKRIDEEAMEFGEATISIAENVTAEVLIRVPALLDILQNEMKAKWTKISQAFIINEIEEFAKQIAALGKEYQLQALSKWGCELQRQALNFDMEKLPDTLASFPELVEGIVSLVKK